MYRHMYECAYVSYIYIYIYIYIIYIIFCEVIFARTLSIYEYA